MALKAPADLLGSLDPLEGDVIKQEEGTVVWRGPGGVVVKMYRRRGRWNAFRGRIFGFRTQRELRRLRHLQRCGIPCTPPLTWTAGRSPVHGYHEVLVMDEVPDVKALDRVLRETGEGLDLAPLFRLVRRMHEAGFCHQTLYPSNLLVRQGAPPEEAFVLCDVPRSWIYPRSIVGTSMARYDLLDLATRLMQSGVPRERLPLGAYELSGEPSRLSIPPGLPDPTTKLRRLLRDGSARLRWAFAWTAAWLHPSKPEPHQGQG